MAYLNNRVFLSMNYGLKVSPRKFDVLKAEVNMKAVFWLGIMALM